MRKALYLRKHLFETSTAYEKRVNDNLRWISDTCILNNVEVLKNSVSIFYTEKDNVKPKNKVISGFTSNKY